MSIVAWACLAIYAITSAATYFPNRHATGDRAVGLIIPMLLTPAVILFAAVLAFAQYRGWATAVAALAILLTLPILVFGPAIAGNLFSSYSAKRANELRGAFRDDPVLSELGAAIRGADHQKLKALLADHPTIDWTMRDRSGLTLLGIAVREARNPMPDQPDHPLCLKVLVDAGAPFQDDAAGRGTRMLSDLITRLDERESQIEILSLLLRAGANPNEVDNYGVPALIGLFMEAKKAKALLDAGAELKSLRRSDEGYQGWDALMFATMRGRWSLAKLYLERGCDPNYQAPDGKSALSIASEHEERLNYENENSNRNAFLRALTAAKAKAALPL